MLLGTKKGWELVDLRQGERQLVLGLSAGDSPTQAQELWEDDRMEVLLSYTYLSIYLSIYLEVLLTYSCTSLLLAEEAGVWGVSREIHWNCQPQVGRLPHGNNFELLVNFTSSFNSCRVHIYYFSIVPSLMILFLHGGAVLLYIGLLGALPQR